ncbi:MAG: LamG-like jellyroll fold domain-containing protein [Saprospiraceae bacterium]
MNRIIPCLLCLSISIPSIHGQNFSLHFDGDDDYAIFPECEAQTFPGFTIEGWFKCGPSIHPQAITMSFLDIPEKNANVTIEVRETGLLRFNYRPVAVVLGGENLLSTTVVDDNIWHHFAAVKGDYDPNKGGVGGLKLYVDGILEAEKTGFFDDITIAPIFEIGRNRYEPTVNYRLFKGHIDDLKIWHRAKYGFEIFNERTSESGGMETDLYSNYKFDIDTDTVYDCSTFKRHGARKDASGANNLPQYSLVIPSLVDKICEPQSVGVQDELINQSVDELALISPNPVSEMLNLELTENKKILSQIYAADGRLLHTITFAEKVISIDVSALPSGAYFLKLSNKETTRTHHFIKI